MGVAVGLKGIVVKEVAPVDVAGLQDTFDCSHLPPQLPDEQCRQRATAGQRKGLYTMMCGPQGVWVP